MHRAESTRTRAAASGRILQRANGTESPNTPAGWAAAEPRHGPRSKPKRVTRKRVMRLLVIAADLRALPTCTPPARVPIKRRWIEPLGLLLAEWRAAGSPAAARRRLPCRAPARARQAAAPRRLRSLCKPAAGGPTG